MLSCYHRSSICRETKHPVKQRIDMATQGSNDAHFTVLVIYASLRICMHNLDTSVVSVNKRYCSTERQIFTVPA